MASIAIVESYPYATVLGGDGVYTDRLRSHLLACGHEIVSVVTDASRGRANPLLRLRSEMRRPHRWVIRGAVRVGESAYLSLLPSLAWNTLRRALGLTPRDGDAGKGERRWLSRLVRKLDPDVVVLVHGACTFSANLTGRRSRIIALRGFLSEIEHQVAFEGQVDHELLAARDAEMASADLVAYNNKADVRSYRERTQRPASLIGMGFPLRVSEARAEAPGPATGPIVLFVGAASNCNLVSLRWFIELCWPSIIRSVPDACFRVVGTAGGAYGRTPPPGVVIVGGVRDLAAEYERSSVVIAPLVRGSNGVKTKVAEALSYGRAVVTTTLGIEADDRAMAAGCLSISDEPDSFSHAVIRLLTDVEERVMVETRARALFDRLYSEHAAYSTLRAFIAGEEHG